LRIVPEVGGIEAKVVGDETAEIRGWGFASEPSIAQKIAGRRDASQSQALRIPAAAQRVGWLSFISGNPPTEKTWVM
jgi:hypothetical protein